MAHSPIFSMAAPDNTPARALCGLKGSLREMEEPVPFFLRIEAQGNKCLEDLKIQTLRCVHSYCVGLDGYDRAGETFDAATQQFHSGHLDADQLKAALHTYMDQLRTGKCNVMQAGGALLGWPTLYKIKAEGLEVLDSKLMGIKGTAAGLYSGAGVVVVLAGLVIADICTTGGLITLTNAAVGAATGGVTAGGLGIAGALAAGGHIQSGKLSTVQDKFTAHLSADREALSKHLMSMSRGFVYAMTAFEDILGYCDSLKCALDSGNMLGVKAKLRSPHARPLTLDVTERAFLTSWKHMGVDQYEIIREKELPSALDARVLYNPANRMTDDLHWHSKGGPHKITVLNRTDGNKTIVIKSWIGHEVVRRDLKPGETLHRGVWAAHAYKIYLYEGKERKAKWERGSIFHGTVYWSREHNKYMLEDRAELHRALM